MLDLKRIWIILMGLLMSFGCSCTPKEILLETGEYAEETLVQETAAETESKLQNVDSKTLIYVYVCGQVQMPGVYRLFEGDRIYQAIDAAGGILSEGDATSLNLAETLRDGQKIYVPSYEEADQWVETEAMTEQTESGMVNINQASKEVLMTLSGIGESKAEAIIRYRDEQGLFHSIEELMNVPGIKEGTYLKIKDRISIN